MNYSPYYQYNPYSTPMYQMAQDEKRELKRTSNALCWTLLVAMFLMSGFIFICIAYLKAVGYTADYTHLDFKGFTPILYYLANGSGYLVSLAVPPLLYFAFRRVPLSSVLPFEKVSFLKGAACVFFGAAACMLANIPANMVYEIERAFGFSGELPELPLTDDIWVLVLYFITIAVIPPIVEELLFRGMVLQSLRKHGDVFAVVSSALLFGLYHGNFVQMVFAFLAGLVMGLAVVRTNSLWTSIAIHFINNSISVVNEIIKRFAGDDTANMVNSVVVSVILVLGILSLIYLLMKDKHFFKGDSGNPLFRQSSKLRALFANPGGIAMLIYSFGTSFWLLFNY